MHENGFIISYILRILGIWIFTNYCCFDYTIKNSRRYYSFKVGLIFSSCWKRSISCSKFYALILRHWMICSRTILCSIQNVQSDIKSVRKPIMASLWAFRNQFGSEGMPMFYPLAFNYAKQLDQKIIKWGWDSKKTNSNIKNNYIMKKI